MQSQVIKVVDDNVGINNPDPQYPIDVKGDVCGYWIRSIGQRGLYSQTYGTYLTPLNASYWSLRSNRGIHIRNKANVRKGVIYHNNANAFGLLDGDGNWAMRIERDNYTQFIINNQSRMVLRANGRLEIPNGTDASGTNNTGYVQIGNNLRIDNDEIITNTNKPLYLQHGNNGDLRIDNTTFFVDASENTVSVQKIVDANNADFYVDPDWVSRLAYIYPEDDSHGTLGSHNQKWSQGYFSNLFRIYEWTLSDRRAKENIQNIDNALTKIMALEGKTYNYIASVFEAEQLSTVPKKKGEMKATGELQSNTAAEINNIIEEGQEVPDGIESQTNTEEKLLPFENVVISERDKISTNSIVNKKMNTPTFGFIAQDVQEILPEVVNYDEANDAYSMSYSAIIPLLVESVKIQQKQITEQQEQIAVQQEQIDELKRMIKK